jgi:enoyl-CoA hydratase/carnithine racemase
MMGFVNRVLPDAEGGLEKYVKDYAETIAGNAPITVDSIKFIVGEALKDPDQRDLKACEAWVTRAFKSADYTEGRKAFMEKRKPNFTGT